MVVADIIIDLAQTVAILFIIGWILIHRTEDLS